MIEQAAAHHGADGAATALADPKARRELRQGLLLAGVVLGVGLVCLSTRPFLEAVARDREERFRTTADLVTARVVSTDSGTVTVEWTQVDVAHRGDLRVPSSGRYDPQEPIEVLVARDGTEVLLPGVARDILGFPLGEVHNFGWVVGLGALVVAAVLAGRTWRIRQILADHAWREAQVRWNVELDALVEEIDGKRVSYAIPEGRQRAIEVAGPQAPDPRAWSVIRPPGKRMQRVKGPRPVATPASSPAAVRTTESATAPPVDPSAVPLRVLLPQGPVGSEPIRWSMVRRRLSADDGTTLATLRRKPERITVSDPAGDLLLKLYGRGRGVQVFDRDGNNLGTIDFRYHHVDVFEAGQERPMAHIRRVDRHSDVIVTLDGVHLGDITYSGLWFASSLARAVVHLVEPQDEVRGFLLLIAGLTARWRPQAAGGGA